MSLDFYLKLASSNKSYFLNPERDQTRLYLPYNLPIEDVIVAPVGEKRFLNFVKIYKQENYNWKSAIEPFLSYEMSVYFQFHNPSTGEKEFSSYHGFKLQNKLTGGIFITYGHLNDELKKLHREREERRTKKTFLGVIQAWVKKSI